MAIREMTQPEMEEYFQEFFKGHTYAEEIAAPAGATAGVFGKEAAIDVMASAVSSAAWDAGFKDTALGQRIWAERGNSVLHELSRRDAKFIDTHERAYRILITKDATDANMQTNLDVLSQKIAENKTERDKDAADKKTAQDAREAEINAVNKTELADYIRTNMGTPELQVYRDMVDTLVTGTAAGKYMTFLGSKNDAELLDLLNTYITATPTAAFAAPFLAKIMTCGTYKYPEVMNDFPGSGNKYFKGRKETAAYTALHTNFDNARTAVFAPLTAATPNNTAIAAEADAYDSLIGTMPDNDAKKAIHTTTVANARTQTQTAAQTAADRAAGLANANNHSIIDFINENQDDVSMSVYRNMVDEAYTAAAAGLATPITITPANIDQHYPNRYKDFLNRRNDSWVVGQFTNYMNMHGIRDLGSPALLASILTSDTYKYDELLIPVPAGGTTPARATALTDIKTAFGKTCRNNALSPLAARDEDTLFINYNMKELEAIVAADPTDPRNATYTDILNKQNAAFDSVFPREKYPNGIADPAVKQMLLKTKFRRYKGGPNNNMNAVKHNLNGIIGADGADTIIGLTDLYGNAVNGAYGRTTMPSLKGDTALIAQNKILEVMCKKNGMTKRETDAVMNRTTNYDAKGMTGIGSAVKLGLKNFAGVALTSTLISAVSTVNPLAGALVGVGFAAHSMWNVAMGEFNAAKERLAHNGIEPQSKDVWAEAKKGGMWKRMALQAIPTLAAYIAPSLPIIGPFLRANPLAMPLAFAAKSGLQQGSKTYNETGSIFQSILNGGIAAAGGFAGGLVGRTIGVAAGTSFNEGYEQANVSEGEGLLGKMRGGLSGLRNLGGDIAKAPGHVIAGVTGAGLGAAAVTRTAVDTGKFHGPMLDRDGDGIDDFIDRDRGEGWANGTDTRADRNHNGINDDHEWALNGKPETMFKDGYYVDKETGNPVNPHLMSVKPGSFRWVDNAATAETAPASAAPAARTHLGDLDLAGERALQGRLTHLTDELVQAKAALQAATQRLETLPRTQFPQSSLLPDYQFPVNPGRESAAAVEPQWRPFGNNLNPQFQGNSLGGNNGLFNYIPPTFETPTAGQQVPPVEGYNGSLLGGLNLGLTGEYPPYSFGRGQ